MPGWYHGNCECCDAFCGTGVDITASGIEAAACPSCLQHTSTTSFDNIALSNVDGVYSVAGSSNASTCSYADFDNSDTVTYATVDNHSDTACATPDTSRTLKRIGVTVQIQNDIIEFVNISVTDGTFSLLLFRWDDAGDNIGAGDLPHVFSNQLACADNQTNRVGSDGGTVTVDFV